jgi:hypothetical protein
LIIILDASNSRHPDEGQDPVSNSASIQLARTVAAAALYELGPDLRQGDGVMASGSHWEIGFRFQVENMCGGTFPAV